MGGPGCAAQPNGYDPDMTTINVTSTTDETLTQAIARRLRGQLGELGISKSQFERLLGWGRGTAPKRLKGEMSFTTEQLEHIELVLGIRVRYLITGEQPSFTQASTARRERNQVSWLPRLDSNQQPVGLRLTRWARSTPMRSSRLMLCGGSA